MFRNDLFKGAHVLVTGGGTGLGRMMAERLLALGASVEIWGRRGPVLEQTAAAMNAAHPGRAFWRSVDIKDPAAIEDAVEAMWSAGRPATHLINNAAGNFVSRTEDLSARAFHAIADIVFHGTFQTTQAVGRRWIRTKSGGSVVSIVVTWVRTGAPFVVPSAMSKAGIDAMTKSLAVEWGRYGIRLNAVAPGTIPTEGMFARLRPGEADPGAEQAKRNPMGRIGTAQDIGDMAAFLLSPIWINGETIALDGGQWLMSGGGFQDYLTWGDARWAEARERIRTRNETDKAQRG
ncbi:MAG TPA: SDR family oxidoreductase [Acetobacteraceae bacterium]|nr:SDR family oxidoreductase [Acetobacteraceae bacterium]